MLKAESCRNCVYAVKAAGRGQAVLVCTNGEGSHGRLTLAHRQGWCRNFQETRIIYRAAVKQPVCEEIRFIALTRGKVAIVDKEDYERLSQYKWYASESKGRFYACRKNKRAVYMHREIMRAAKGMVVDHIDGNGLNNRRSNLRVCRVCENIRNRRGAGGRSRYKGVSFVKHLKKWKAEITCGGRRRHLGCFEEEIEAARAYDGKARELFGEFAYVNLPEGGCKSTRHEIGN